MLNAQLEGKATSEEIAQFAKGRAKQKIPELLAALDGHRMSEHDRQLIRYSNRALGFRGGPSYQDR